MSMIESNAVVGIKNPHRSEDFKFLIGRGKEIYLKLWTGWKL